MPYVGNKPEIGNFRKCDAITTSATATYNLLVGGVAVNPNQNQCIVSLNGVIQSSGNSYTIASSQITFASTLASSDVIDFILILGDTLDVGVPSDDTVDASKITANVITGQSALGATPADTDELLISDAGVLKRVDYSYLKSTINTPYCARMAKVANQTISNSSWTLFDLASGTEVYDKGSIADLSTSKITVPSGAAGFWVFNFFLRVNNFRADRNILQLYKNGVATSGTTAGDNFEMGKWDATSQYSSLFGHLVLNLAVADYIQPYFYQNSGSSETIFERSFSGWYLGASS